jgi:hypothetical protein
VEQPRHLKTFLSHQDLTTAGMTKVSLSGDVTVGTTPHLSAIFRSMRLATVPATNCKLLVLERSRMSTVLNRLRRTFGSWPGYIGWSSCKGHQHFGKWSKVRHTQHKETDSNGST